MTKQERAADCADFAMAAHRVATATPSTEPEETSVIDLLADLMHYAKIRDVDFSDALRIARVHFDEEEAIDE